MKANSRIRSRRDFFMQGAAVMGAGVASAAGPVAQGPPAGGAGDEHSELQRKLAVAEDHVRIRELHRLFISRVQEGAYGSIAELFDEHALLELSGERAVGRTQISRLFVQGYRTQGVASLHVSYRHSPLHPQASICLSDDRSQARAVFPIDAEVIVPLRGNSTLVQMARLQGQVADRAWVGGRFEASFGRAGRQWLFTTLQYLAT